MFQGYMLLPYSGLTLKIEEAGTSEMSTPLPTATWCDNPRTELTP
jgi:hypothetical protein